MNIDLKNLLPKDYWDFISNNKLPTSFTDVKASKEWKLASLDESSFHLYEKSYNEQSSFYLIVQNLAKELGYSNFNNLSTKEETEDQFFSSLITIGKSGADYLCITINGAVWEVSFDPREVKKLASSFNDWNLAPTIKQNVNLTIEKAILGKWKAVATDSSLANLVDSIGTFIFNDDKSCLQLTMNISIDFKWGINTNVDPNVLCIVDIEDDDEEFYEIISLSDDLLVLNMDGDELTFQKEA